MGIIDFFRSLTAKKVEEPSFVIPVGRKNDRFLLSLAEALESKKGIKVTETYKLAKRIKPEKLELASRMCEITARCINFYALQVVGPGFELVDCKPETKEFLKEFIERNHLLAKLEDVVRDMCIYGNGWLEKKFNAEGKFVEVDYINGKYMDFQRDYNGHVIEDEFGNIRGYVFKDWTGQKRNLNPNQVAHFKLFSHGNELAFGFVEPLFHLIYDKLNARKGISQAGWRAGHELLVAYIGDKPDERIGYHGHRADEDFSRALADELEDIKGKHKLVLPYWARIEKIEGTKVDWSPLLNYFDTRICAGFGIPVEIAIGGIGKANRATLEVAVTRDLDRRIRSFQNKISIVLKNDIFGELKKQGDIIEIPNIRWHDITPADLNRLAKRLVEYIQAGIIKPEDVKEIIYELEGFPLPKKLFESLSDFVTERKHITVEEAILFLKTLKTSFPDETIIKLIDSLVEKIMLKTTGQQIPQETGGVDETKDDENDEGI